jgi:hypothetical protein
MESYLWKPGKDEPVKDCDHAMDALRYACYYFRDDAVFTDDSMTGRGERIF